LLLGGFILGTVLAIDRQKMHVLKFLMSQEGKFCQEMRRGSNAPSSLLLGVASASLTHLFATYVTIPSIIVKVIII